MPVSRSDRLFQIMQILRQSGTHRAQDIAQRMNVSLRTVYRDIDTLIASGVPVKGTRGIGYHCQDLTTLSPLSLNKEELEMLQLALAVVLNVADPQMQKNAQSLSRKIEAALPVEGIETKDAWKFARSPFSDMARGFSFLPLIRAAVKAKQKLQITYTATDHRITSHRIRPLKLENWGRVWTLTAWCETRNSFQLFRLDLLQSVEAQPEMFVDEVGKRLSDAPG